MGVSTMIWIAFLNVSHRIFPTLSEAFPASQQIRIRYFLVPSFVFILLLENLQGAD
jgi:hypothetical protein